MRNRRKWGALERVIAGALRNSMDAHGPIETEGNVQSAAKRIGSTVRGAIRAGGPVVDDLKDELARAGADKDSGTGESQQPHTSRLALTAYAVVTRLSNNLRSGVGKSGPSHLAHNQEIPGSNPGAATQGAAA